MGILDLDRKAVEGGRGHGAAGADPCATLVDLLRRRAGDRPEGLAYAFLDDGGREGERLSYGELDRAARRIAARLQATGAPGDRALAVPGRAGLPQGVLRLPLRGRDRHPGAAAGGQPAQADLAAAPVDRRGCRDLRRDLQSRDPGTRGRFARRPRARGDRASRHRRDPPRLLGPLARAPDRAGRPGLSPVHLGFDDEPQGGHDQPPERGAPLRLSAPLLRVHAREHQRDLAAVFPRLRADRGAAGAAVQRHPRLRDVAVLLPQRPLQLAARRSRPCARPTPRPRISPTSSACGGSRPSRSPGWISAACAPPATGPSRSIPGSWRHSTGPSPPAGSDGRPSARRTAWPRRR